ncbi:hypothetical protein [Pseudomonas nabeulensis]|uniref:hypothetical protein n=1 Tax=Pseudomonas nabeulensis TaxID=2293833 RepID=UPI0030846DA2
MRKVLLIIDVQSSFNLLQWLTDGINTLLARQGVDLWRHHFGKVIARDDVLPTIAS